MVAACPGRQCCRGEGVVGGPVAAWQAPNNDAKADPPGKLVAQKRVQISEFKGNT